MGVNKEIVTRRQLELEKKEGDLLTAKHMVESETFQTYFAEKMHKKRKDLKSAYDCKDMAELKYMKGQYDAYTDFYKCIQEIDTALTFIRNDLDKLK